MILKQNATYHARGVSTPLNFCIESLIQTQGWLLSLIGLFMSPVQHSALMLKLYCSLLLLRLTVGKRVESKQGRGRGGTQGMEHRTEFPRYRVATQGPMGTGTI